MNGIIQPQAGDFCVCSIGGQGGGLISLMEEIAYRHSTHWDHAYVYLGDGTIVQAQRPRAVRVPLASARHEYSIWSAGLITLTPAQRTAIVHTALALVGTPYSWLDYAAIAAHRFHIRTPELKTFIADSGHMICSQLVDQCYASAGVHLFDDRRWSGYVTPYDLGTLISARAIHEAT